MIVAGFGFRASAHVTSLKEAFERATAGHDASALATLSDKADNPAFVAFAKSLNLPIKRVDPARVLGIDTQTQSPYSQAARFTGSVAEATALSAAGPAATLLGQRVVSADRLATCALAQSGAEGQTI